MPLFVFGKMVEIAVH